MILPHVISALWLTTFTYSSLVPVAATQGSNSTFYNPIIPGFHPDPSCIFLPEWDETFFCASSSFNAFPGIPLHASKDLQNWKLIGTIASFRGAGHDEKDATDASRWDNIIFRAKDPYDPASWSNAVHFEFEGYDTEPFWDDDGKTYMNGAHAWKVGPWIQQTEANLDTGEVIGWKTIWNGTGGMKDHIFIAKMDGGTGLGHMVTIARSKNIDGPYESNPANPILTNANTTEYFQTVGHADLFQDASGNWWSVALATRSGPEWLHFPMVRETVLTAATWKEGEWPYLTPISGKMSGWKMPPYSLEVEGPGYESNPLFSSMTVTDRLSPWISLGEVKGDDVSFGPNSSIPAHFTHWRYPIENSYTVSPPEHLNSLRLTPSKLNLTAFNGNYAGQEGQTFIGRRQQDTLFTYSVDVDFTPTAVEEEVGVSVFLTQNHHFDLGVVLLPTKARTRAFPGRNLTVVEEPDKLKLHFRFRGESYVPIPANIVVPVPEEWVGEALHLEIKGVNATHYSFSAGPAGAASCMQTLLYASNNALSWGFTGECERILEPSVS
ncbi:glycoside hydrolase family 43 protein [Colletotrichum incanum]|uniref:Glycoside hydrolase family 43 protein n=1 Tax=Colletotrichum incanum TaxID=1573173 RepID=A0A162PZD5_COLIC|nr:glycoside hydrolase family 43 protein [Colletotrichum incanum]